MRRIVLLLAVLAAGVAAAAPWWTGRRLERAWHEAAAEHAAASSLDVASERYERGWLRSQAVTVLRPRGGASGPALRLRHDIEHGPLPWGALRSGDWASVPVLARVTSEATWETPEGPQPLPVVLHSLVRPDGGATVSLHPGPDLAGAPDAVGWSEMELALRIAPGGDSVAGKLLVPRFEMADAAPDGGTLSVGDLRWRFVYHGLGEGALAEGSSLFELGRLDLAGPGVRATLRDLEIGSESGASEGVWSTFVEASFAELAVGDRSYGPGSWRVEAEGLAAEPLAELARVAEGVGGEGADAARAQAEAMLRLGELWPRIMAAGPALAMPWLRVETPEGELRASWRVGVGAADPAVLANPFLALSTLEMEADVEIPAALVGRWVEPPDPGAVGLAGAPPGAGPGMAERMGAWIEAGWLMRRGPHYVADVRLRDAALRVNGRAVPLSAPGS